MNWEPLIQEHTLQECVYTKLHEIKEALLANKSAEGSESLFGGDLGVALFFLYYYKLTKDEDNLNIAEIFLGDAYDSIPKNSSPLFSFAGGISGVCWATEFARTNEFIDVDVDEIFPDIDPIISNYMAHEMHRGYYDYLHGSLGAGFYFLKKDTTPTIRKDIEALIDRLHELDINGKKIWNYHHGGEQIENSTNLGLSHGIPSILVFLLKAYQKNISPEKTRLLIDELINYLLQHRQDPQVHQSYYAYSIPEKPTEDARNNTRLAWCYGDLGVCCALWQAAKTLDDPELKVQVLEIMRYTATRRDLDENGVYDAGLCHGAAGIAHIFNRFYQDTHLEIFKETALFWYNKTVEMATFEDGLAGYKAHMGNEKGYENCPGLLEGVAGIGLALIGAIADFEPNWDECLLIS